LVTTAELVGVPAALFLIVYLCCTLSAARALSGAARGCAVAAFIAVVALLAFCGWALAFAGAVAVAAALYGGRRMRRYAGDWSGELDSRLPATQGLDSDGSVTVT
jgi:hypothetical protein